jgi:lipid A 3-O-deacylase
MTRLLVLLTLALLFLPPVAAAHGVDENDSSDLLGPGRLLRFDYANDYFTGTDRYYTQGLGLQYFDPALRRSPLMGALVSLPDTERFYGLALRNSGYTPSRLSSDAALIGDRPFAATLTLGHVLVSRDRDRGLTLTARLDAGVIGQAAGGKWQQVGIHRATGNLLPHGWDNQVRNDLALDYSLRLEKTLKAAPFGDFGVYGEATAGTLHDNAALGAFGKIGRIEASSSRRFYLFGRAESRLIGYDATLQGGLLNRGSPYTLTSPQVRRSVLRADIGFTIDRGSYALIVTRTYLSREFTGGLSHQWVEISFLRRL